MLNNILLVGLGGGAGSILRYLCQRSFNLNFPIGTLGVNIAGCFLIGLLAGVAMKGFSTPYMLLLATGFCGGFTTFSAFTMESIQMLNENRWATFLLYASASIIGGLAFTFLGYKITS